MPGTSSAFSSARRTSASATSGTIQNRSRQLDGVGAGRRVEPALIVNFLLLRNFVFRAREERLAPPMLRYLLSVAGFGVIAYGMIYFLANQFGTPVVLAKISVETLLFVVNFVVQRDLVFQRNREN